MSIRGAKQDSKTGQRADRDIDLVKRSLELARQARDYAEAILETIQEPLLVLDGDMRVLSANTSFCRTFRASSHETVGRSIFELGDGRWNIPRLRQLLEQLLPRNSAIDDFQVDHQSPLLGHTHMLLNARQLHREGVDTGMILLAIRDITGQVEAARALAANQARYGAIRKQSEAARLLDQQDTERTGHRHDPRRELTPRQREVLQLLAEGKSLKEVAAILRVSVKTAEFHKYRIMNKLGIHTNAEMTKCAVKLGVTSL